MKDTISIFNLNCWLFPPPLSTDCDKRLSEIIALIKKHEPDVITLQEVWSNKYLRQIRRRLHDYRAVFSDTSLYNQSGLVTLTKQKPASSRVNFFRLSLKENATEWFLRKGYIIVRLGVGDYFVDIINVHLNAPFSSRERTIPQEQFEEVATAASGSNVVICGDLNMSEEALEKAARGRFTRLCNSDITSDGRNPYCHKRFNRLMSHEDKKLDYILFKGRLQAEAEYNVIKMPFVSDHYPMFSRVHLKA